jgi:hypothetical protein
MHLIIAMILLIGPNHELKGGIILPGASGDMVTCEAKAREYLKSVGEVPANTVAVPACAEMASGTST